MLTAFNVAVAIFGISLLVIVHESGHYLVARAFGMRVLTYSIGLGKVIWKHKPKDSPTTFQICAVPLLAYVQIDGMNPAEEIDPDDPMLYPNKGVVARTLTIFAGPLANYLAAALLTFAVVMIWGEQVPQELPEVQVGAVLPGYPGAEAGLRDGDIIVEANHTPISESAELIEITAARPDQETDFLIRRDEEEFHINITPQNVDGEGKIGIHIGAAYVFQQTTVARAAWIGILVPYNLTVATLDALEDKIENQNTEGIQGPVGMTRILADGVSRGIRYYMQMLVALSVALGFFNLLPLPALDGGRLVFLGYEIITRRRANEKVEAGIHMVGLLLLLGILILFTVRDIQELILG